MLKASWIPTVAQWVSLRMGLTNSVQPYCMLDSVTVDNTMMASCTHRFSKELGPACSGIIGFSPSKPAALPCSVR